jgi:hypothetical protein
VAVAAPPGEPAKSFRGSFAAQSPLSSYFVICEGGGAPGRGL